MGEDHLEQFWVVHWNSRWADQEPVTADVFDRLSILEGLLRDVPPSSFVRPTLMTAQIDFLVGHMEGVWGDLAEGLRFQGNYASLYFYCQQFRDHAANMLEGIGMEGEEMSDSDDEEVELEAANANMMGADYFSSDDEEEEAVEYNDLDGPEAEPEDDVASKDTWIWKSASP